jgi:hypothetical protein
MLQRSAETSYNTHQAVRIQMAASLLLLLLLDLLRSVQKAVHRQVVTISDSKNRS